MKKSLGWLLLAVFILVSTPVLSHAQSELLYIFRVSWSPDGARLLYTMGNHITDTEVWVYEWETGLSQNLTADLPNHQSDPLWSPDSQRIVFSSTVMDESSGEWKSDIWIMDVDGSNLTNLTEGNPLDLQPFGFASNGQYISVYSHNYETSQSGAWVLAVDGSSLIPIELPGDLNIGIPRFAPDGSYLMVTTVSQTPPAEFQLWRVPFDNGVVSEAISIFRSSQVLGDFIWSPDGGHLLIPMPVDEDQVWRLHRLDLISGELTAFETEITDYQIGAVWSPDGARILVITYNSDDETEGAYLVEADGSNAVFLMSDNAVYADTIAWSPDGQQLVIIRFIETQYGEYSGIYWVEDVASPELIRLIGEPPPS